jgi:hypothetical protein
MIRSRRGLGSPPLVTDVPVCSDGQIIGADGKCQTTAGTVFQAALGLPARIVESVAPSFFAGDGMGMKRLGISVVGWGAVAYFLLSGGGNSRRYGR